MEKSFKNETFPALLNLDFLSLIFFSVPVASKNVWNHVDLSASKYTLIPLKFKKSTDFLTP